MKKILVTGGSGFLGNTIASRLKDVYEITILNRRFRPPEDLKFPAIQCDLSKSTISENQLENWDIILHAAGKSGSSSKEANKQSLFFKSNVVGTKNLLKSLKKHPPKLFIYISSVSVYGLDEGLNIDETRSLKAKDAYGNSKVKAEKEILKWGENNDNINIIILRLPLLVGEDPPGNLGKMIYSIKKRRYVRIGGGEARKSMVWVEDVADLIPKLNNQSGIYNLSDQYHPSFAELENIIAKKVGAKIYSIPVWLANSIANFGSALNRTFYKFNFPLDKKTFTKIVKSVTIDDSKATNELGWKPSKVLDQMKDMQIDQ